MTRRSGSARRCPGPTRIAGGLSCLRWSVGYGVGLKAMRALGWMAAFALIGWVVGLYANRRMPVSRWTLLWYSVSCTVPGFSLFREDDVPMSLGARSWFYVQRLFLLCVCTARRSGGGRHRSALGLPFLRTADSCLQGTSCACARVRLGAPRLLHLPHVALPFLDHGHRVPDQ